MSLEHPIFQEIRCVVVYRFEHDEQIWHVGVAGVTRIEACTKSGMFADIPYIRIWNNDKCLAEYCQHHICGVEFGRVAAS